MAADSYHNWFGVKIEHLYFTKGHVPVDLVPTQATALLLKRNNMLVKYGHGEVHFFYQAYNSTEPGKAPEIENPGILKFEVISRDPLFINYTDIPFTKSGETLFFQNTTNSSELQIGTTSSGEQMDRDSIGMLQINVRILNTDLLSLTFNARKVFKQYVVIVPDFMEMHIEGFNNEKYEGPVAELMPGGITTYVFSSTVPLPLRETPAGNSKLMFRFENSFSDKQDSWLRLPDHSPEYLKVFQEGINKGVPYVRSIIHLNTNDFKAHSTC
jgi:hypothetical protein